MSSEALVGLWREYPSPLTIRDRLLQAAARMAGATGGHCCLGRRRWVLSISRIFFPETGLCDGKACRDGYLSKSRLENAGVVLIAIVLGANAVRYYVRRNPVHLVFGALALAFVCREVHFTGTSSGVYVALVLIGAWVFLWRRKLAPSLFVRTFRVWLGSTAVTYVLSQLIARRVFRKLNLPYEDAVNVPLEELVENVAHVMFLVTSLIGVSVRSGRK